MFTSGRWTAYWTAEPQLEDPMQNVHDLTLTFDADEVRGSGSDMVGDFRMSGRVHNDAVHVEKSYLGQHVVLYEGKRDENGCIAGEWRIEGNCSGHFLWVRPAVDDPTPLVETWYRNVKRSRSKAETPSVPARKGCLGMLVFLVILTLFVLRSV